MICVAFNNFLFMFLLGLLKIITFSATTCIFGDIVWNLMRARREEECLRVNCFDVRRWKARSGKRANSENQKGDVPRNYIRFGRGDVVEWKEARKRFCEIQESRGIDNCKLQRLEKVERGETKFR